MAKITRIKASDGPRKAEQDEPAITRKKVVVADKKTAKKQRQARRTAEKQLTVAETNPLAQAQNSKKSHKPGHKPFVLFRPFVALWHYVRGAWQELRQVRWPNRKTTWKMVLAVIVYSLLFAVIISLLDILFSWLFNLILNR